MEMVTSRVPPGIAVSGGSHGNYYCRKQNMVFGKMGEHSALRITCKILG